MFEFAIGFITGFFFLGLIEAIYYTGYMDRKKEERQ